MDNSTEPTNTPWSRLPWIGFIAGIFVLGQLYGQASQGSVPYLFARFWLGMLVFFIPLFWRQLSTGIARSERASLLVAAAVFSFLPKLFRCTTYFCYSDELTWWRGVQDVLTGSSLLAENPLGEVQGLFPGMPLLTLVIQKAGGFSTFQAGVLLMGFAHLLVLITIFLLGEKIFHSSKVGALAALLYATNPAFFFFSTQYSYESLGIPLILLILLFVQSILSGPEKRVGRAWIITSCLVVTSLVIVHHLSALMLLAILALMVLGAVFLPRISWFQKSSWHLNLVTVFAFVFTFGWLSLVARDVFRYIGDPFLTGLQQISGYQTRQLFAGNPLPVYEIGAGYLAAVLICLLGLFGAFLIYHTRKNLFAAQIGMLAFGSLYFITAPLILTSWGSEAGRRSWTFSFISLSLLGGFVLQWFLSRKSFGRFQPGWNTLRGVITAALVVLLVGGIASSTTISYRFPGEYLLNSDARSYDAEIIEAAQWLLNQAGADNLVLGDRTTERIFGSYGLQDPAMLGGPRPWEVFLPTSWTEEAVYWLEQAEAPFVVVDKRMAELAPQMDIRFQRGEPTLDYTDRPLPAESIVKFDQLSQLDRLYDSGNIRIYSLNHNSQNIPSASLGEPQATGRSPGMLVAETEITNFLVRLLNLLRSILLIGLLLILPGLVIGKFLFPDWSSLDRILQILIGAALSISLIVLLAVILAGYFPSNVVAANLTIILLVFVLVYGLIRIFDSLYQAQVTREDFIAYFRQAFGKIRESNEWVPLGMGLAGLLLVVFYVGYIQPAAVPRTSFSINISDSPPGFQINNLEGVEKSYRVRISSRTGVEWNSNPIVLDPDQTLHMEIPPSLLIRPVEDVLELELYLQGQATPYRSLHFVPLPPSPSSQPNSSLPDHLVKNFL